MGDWIAWHSLVFLLPLGLGSMLACGAAFGSVDGDVDIDVDFDADIDADVDADADADAETEGTWSATGAHALLELLGFGKVPLTVLLMLELLLFGIFGLATKQLALGWLSGPATAALLAIGCALPLSLFLAGIAARGLGKLLPGTETYAVGRHGLIGLTGVAEFPVDPKFGIVNLADRGGARHKLRCRTYQGTLPKGHRVLVTDYDERLGVFVVEEDPLFSAGERQD